MSEATACSTCIAPPRSAMEQAPAYAETGEDGTNTRHRNNYLYISYLQVMGVGSTPRRFREVWGLRPSRNVRIRSGTVDEDSVGASAYGVGPPSVRWKRRAEGAGDRCATPTPSLLETSRKGP